MLHAPSSSTLHIDEHMRTISLYCIGQIETSCRALCLDDFACNIHHCPLHALDPYLSCASSLLEATEKHVAPVCVALAVGSAFVLEHKKPPPLMQAARERVHPHQVDLPAF